MGLLKKAISKKDIHVNNEWSAELLKMLGIDAGYSNREKLGEITYFTCLKHLSECMGKLPIIQYREDPKKGKERIKGKPLHYLLNTEPNPYMTATTFWETAELNRNHFGNAFVYQEYYRVGRNAGQVKNLWILPTNEVTVWVDNRGIFGIPNGIWYVWQDSRSGKSWKFNCDEILHYKSSLSWDGIVGLSIRDILILQIEQAMSAQKFLNKLYKTNMFGGKIMVQYTGDMDIKGEGALVKKLESFSSNTGSGKFIPLPLGITATMLDMKLTDAQFFELNKYSALQIAAAFGIKPNILNNYDKSSYSNSETQQLDFYINSLLPNLKGYKEENTRKLLTTSELADSNTLEHDTRELFKLDPVNQMNRLQKGVNNFMITANEAREELGQPYSEEPVANMLIGNGNYIRLDQVGTQWRKGKNNDNSDTGNT